MHIKIKPHGTYDLPTMHDVAMRYIFDRTNVRKDEMVLLEESIDAYSKIADLNRGDQWELRRVVNALIADEHGYFDRAKLLMIEHKIHYRQFYKSGLPYVLTEGRKSWNKS